jgi:hypothetical protein
MFDDDPQQFAIAAPPPLRIESPHTILSTF